MPDVLVTGTDTGVGKTVVAAALVRALRARGVRAIGFKPAETGREEGQPADSALLEEASGEATPLAAPLLQLLEPLAPAVAGERAGTRIHPEEVEQRIALLRGAGYSLVIEGAGGVMAPLSWEKTAPFFYTALDLADHCGLDAVVVARAGLGTLNHVTLTVAMLRSRNIPIKGIVLNRRSHPSARTSPNLAEATNPAALARMLPGLLILEIPHHSRPDVVDAAIPHVGRLLS